MVNDSSTGDHMHPLLIMRGAGLLSHLGLPISHVERMGLLALQRELQEQREADRLRAAHLRKFAYKHLGDAGTRDDKTRAATFGDFYPVVELRGKPVPHLQQIRRETKRYTGEVLRAIEADRGCGHRKPAKAHEHFTKLTLPWESTSRMVGFNVGVNDQGKQTLTGIGVYRVNCGRLRRCKGLEANMTDLQWESLTRRLVEHMGAQREQLIH